MLSSDVLDWRMSVLELDLDLDLDLDVVRMLFFCFAYLLGSDLDVVGAVERHCLLLAGHLAQVEQHFELARPPARSYLGLLHQHPS